MLTDQATSWIEEGEPGWQGLTEGEKREILTFSILWSLFEARVFDCEIDSSRAFWRKVGEWSDAKVLEPRLIREEIEYLRDRYITDNDTNDHFDSLNIRNSDIEERVSNVLSGELDDIEDEMATALFVVYRLRNNFFHGEKWSYGFRNQFGNFRVANRILMKGIDIDSNAQSDV